MSGGAKLASGYVDLTVQYGSAMKQIASDLTGIEKQSAATGKSMGSNLGSGVKSALSGSGATKAAGQLGSDMGSSLAGGFKKMLAGAAIGGAVAGIVSSVKTMSLEFRDMNNNLRMLTGKTGDDLKGLSESAKNVGKNTVQGFNVAGQAIGELSRLTGLSGEPLESLATQMLNLSHITGTDVTANIQAATRSFGDWNVAAADMGPTMDILWKAGQQTGQSVDQLATMTKQFGAPMRAMGFSLKETAVLMGNFQKTGGNTELIMGSMRIALRNFAKAGESAPETLRKLISQIKGIEDPTEAAAMAMQVFGSRAGADMADSIRGGKFEIDQMLAAIDGSSDSINKASDDVTTFGERISILKDKGFAALEPVITPVMNAMNKGFDFMVAHGDIFGPIAAGVGGLAAVLGIASVAMTAFTAVCALNPFVLIGAAVVALIAGLALFFTKTETGRAIVSAAWNGIKGAFETAKAAIEGVLHGLGAAMDWLWNSVMMPAWNGIKSVVSGAQSAITAVWDAITSGVGAVGGVVTNLWQGVFMPAWNGIKSVVQEGWTFVQGVFEQFKAGFQALGDSISGIASKIADTIKSAFAGIADAIAAPLRAIGGAIQGLPGSVAGVNIPGADAVKGIGGKLAGLAEGGVAGVDGDGVLFGPGDGASDSILAVGKDGVPTARVSRGEGVVRESAMRRGAGRVVSALNAGWLPGHAEGDPKPDPVQAGLMAAVEQGQKSVPGGKAGKAGKAVDAQGVTPVGPDDKQLKDALADMVGQGQGGDSNAAGVGVQSAAAMGAAGAAAGDGGRTEGYIPAGAGGTGQAGTSFMSGIYNLGAEAANNAIDQAAGAASMGAGMMGGPAAGMAIGMGADLAKKGVSYGFQMAGIATDAVAEIFSPFGTSRWLSTDPTSFMPQTPGQQADVTTAEKADSGANPGGPVQPHQMAGQAQIGKPVEAAKAGAGVSVGPPPLAEEPKTAPTGAPAAAPPPPKNDAATPQQQKNPLDIAGIFDRGGMLPADGIAINKSRRAEPMPVFTSPQWGTLNAIANSDVAQPDPAMMGGADYSVKIDSVTVKDVADLERQMSSKQRLQMMRHAGRP